MRIILQSGKEEELGVFECQPSERLLYAGLRAGLPLPHECASGTCGSCKGRLLSGETDDLWSDAPGRKALRSGTTDILLCQSRAGSDCTIGIRLAAPVSQPQVLPAYFSGWVRRSGMLTQDVLIMELALDRPMSFAAGQFVVLEVEGLDGFRAYSMVNFKQPCHALELIVKKKPGGGFSQRLFSQELSSMRFKVFGPLGRATLEPEEEGTGDLVCVAGGTGIAGIMAILARASQSGHLDAHKALVCFGVRTAADLFFLPRFAALRRQHPDSLKVIVALSEEEPPASIRSSYPCLTFCKGFVHEALAAQSLEGFTDVVAYAGGPPLAVDAATSVLLLKHQIPANRIRFDRFG